MRFKDAGLLLLRFFERGSGVGVTEIPHINSLLVYICRSDIVETLGEAMWFLNFPGYQ